LSHFYRVSEKAKITIERIQNAWKISKTIDYDTGFNRNVYTSRETTEFECVRSPDTTTSTFFLKELQKNKAVRVCSHLWIEKWIQSLNCTSRGILSVCADWKTEYHSLHLTKKTKLANTKHVVRRNWPKRGGSWLGAATGCTHYWAERKFTTCKITTMEMP
jgi:hypothetical protein